MYSWVDHAKLAHEVERLEAAKDKWPEQQEKKRLRLRAAKAALEKRNAVINDERFRGVADAMAVSVMKFDLATVKTVNPDQLHEIAKREHEKVAADVPPGALAKLTSSGGLGMERVKLTHVQRVWLNHFLYTMIAVAAVLLIVTSLMFQGLTEMTCQDCPDFNRSTISAPAVFVDKMFFPRDGCISDWARNAYAYALLILWVPACVLFAFVYPAWQLSLQLAVTLAADNVDDLMKDLGPLAAQDYVGGDDSEGESRWRARVERPGAMLVTTLEELSVWGTAMGVSILGFWALALCLVPTSIASNNREMQVGLGLVALFPIMILIAPANVSSSCDELLNQLNDISFMGNRHHKDRCTHLRHSLMNLNRGQGLGFVVFGTVIDTRFLAKMTAALAGVTVSTVSALVAMGTGEQQQALDHPLDHPSNQG